MIGFISNKRFRAGLLVSLMSGLYMSVAGAATENVGEQLPPNVIDGPPHLVIDTDSGDIVVELFPDAAPNTIAALVDALNMPGDTSSTFSYTQSHFEIRMDALPVLEGFEVPKEINAESLGMDKQKFTDAGEAMNFWQHEIFRAYTNKMKKVAVTEKLKSWIDSFEKDMRVDFLVGVSSKEILEALGHTFVDGIESKPQVRGSVLLKPASATTSGPVISITVDELPGRTGEWVVIGQVVEGLELAHDISIRPNSMHNRPRHTPVDPVVIHNVSVAHFKLN